MSHTVYAPLAQEVCTIMGQLAERGMPRPEVLRLAGAADGTSSALVGVRYVNGEDAEHAAERMREHGWTLDVTPTFFMTIRVTGREV